MKGYCNKFFRKTRLQIYTCYIRPILEYGDVVWINLTMGDSEKLEDINRRAIRQAIGAKLGTSHQFLYQESGLQKLTTWRRNNKIKMMFKIMKNKRDFQRGDKDIPLMSERNRYSVRNTGLLSTSRCKTSTYQNSFLPSAIALWNSLSDDQKNCEMLDTLKSKLKNNMKPNELYEIEMTRRSSILLTSVT